MSGSSVIKCLKIKGCRIHIRGTPLYTFLDSGSPFCTQSNVEGEARSTIVALYHAATEAETIYMSDGLEQCRMFASKITADVINWIKDIDEFFMNTE